MRDGSAISDRTRDMVIFSGGTSVQEHGGETGATPAKNRNMNCNITWYELQYYLAL